MAVTIEKALMPGIEHAEPARLPDPLLAGMPFVDVLVPDDLHLGDALAGQRLGRGRHGGIVTGVPGREQGRAFGFGEAGEIVDLAQGRGRRLFEKDVQAGLDALAGDFVARPMAGW